MKSFELTFYVPQKCDIDITYQNNIAWELITVKKENSETEI